MKTKFPILLLTVFIIAYYQNSYAHGIGGGGKSYKFDKNDNAVDHEAIKRASEEQEARENWDDFMNAIKKQEKKTNTDGGSDLDNTSNL